LISIVRLRTKTTEFLWNEDVWWSEGIAPPFLTSALDGMHGQLHVAAALTASIYRTGGWVGPRFLLDAMENRKLY
jgi:hypothetical protein